MGAKMKENLNILLVEDNPNDAKILSIEIGRTFFPTIRNVKTEEELRTELNSYSPDIIISDYNLPTFTGMKALAVREELVPHLPFILVTGSLNEETAVSVMKAGADDYVLKENLSRLVPAVKSAIEKRKAIREKAEAEKKLIEAEVRFRSIFENTVIGLYRTSPDGKIMLANPALINMLGFSSFEELTKRNLTVEGFESEKARIKFITEIEKNGSVIGFEAMWKRADGTPLYVRESGRAVKDVSGKTIFYEGVVEDVTNEKLAKAALKESEEKYRIITENSADVITVSDLSLNTIYISPSILQVRGYTVEEAPPQKLSDILTHESFQKVMAIFTDEMARELAGNHDPNRSVLIEVEEYHKNGSIINAELKANFIRDENDNPVSILTVTRDITERKKSLEKIRQSEERFRATWENSFDGMRLTDEHGIIIEVNSAFCNLVNKKREELIGQKFTIVYHEKQQDAFDRYLKNFNTKSFRPQLETEIQLWDGKLKWFSLSNSLIETEQNTLLMLSIIRDVTERKEHEQKLVAALEKAEEMNRVKSYFFANMSHELRTPFVGILGFAELLHDTVSEEDKDMVDHIIRSAHRMQNTLTKILDLTNLEFLNTKPEKKPTNIVAIVERVFNDFKLAAEKKNLTFKKDIRQSEIILNTDNRLFTTILYNLVDNAIIYTEEGEIAISAEIKKEFGADIFELQVKDTGIGIPNDKLELIWKEFRQVSEGLSRTFEGTGLGLTITKKNCEMLGGEISVESEVDRGTTFTVRFTLNEKVSAKEIRTSKEVVPEPDKLKKRSKSSKKLLLIENDDSNRDVIERYLSRYFSIESCVNADDALPKVTANSYDLILMDINLGRGTNGVELTEIIRELPNYNSTPIIAVTAFASYNDEKEFLSRGMTHYIAKPFFMQDLLKMVDEALEATNN